LVLSILLTLRRPPSPSLFPYTTLFRSRPARVRMDSSGIHLPQRPNLVPVAAAGQRLRQRHVGDTVVRIYRCVGRVAVGAGLQPRSEEHTSELQSRFDIVCRLLLEKKKA